MQGSHQGIKASRDAKVHGVCGTMVGQAGILGSVSCEWLVYKHGKKKCHVNYLNGDKLSA